MVLETSVERDGWIYYVTLGEKEICTTYAQDPSDVKEWISEIEKRYLGKKTKKNKKQQPLVVGLWAERSIYYPDGQHNFYPKDAKFYHNHAPYELLVLCIGDQCLLWELDVQARHWIEPRKGYIPDEVPKPLKDFLSSSEIIVVGLGVNAMVKKLESETNLLIAKKVELRDLVQKKRGMTEGEFAKSNLESLAKLIIGPEWEVVKPDSMTWWSDLPWPRHCDYLSEDLVEYCTTQAFLFAEIASKLLAE